MTVRMNGGKSLDPVNKTSSPSLGWYIHLDTVVTMLCTKGELFPHIPTPEMTGIEGIGIEYCSRCRDIDWLTVNDAIRNDLIESREFRIPKRLLPPYPETDEICCLRVRGNKAICTVCDQEFPVCEFGKHPLVRNPISVSSIECLFCFNDFLLEK